MKYVYMGSFPPPYGGVTVKNENLYKLLSKHINVRKVDFSRVKRKKLLELLKLIFYIIQDNTMIVGVTGRKTKKRFTKILYKFSKKSMRRSIVMVMGGTAADDIASDPVYRKHMSCYKQIFVETAHMKKKMEASGLDNVSIYPNGRFKPAIFPTIRESDNVKCVFFSLINEMKGVDIILDTAEKMKNVTFDFWGHVEDGYTSRFQERVKRANNVQYKGVFKGSSNEVYDLLSDYDVLLLPTKYTTEGIPGVLVEAKIAGIPSIVSDVSYNREIVSDGIDGIVLRENDSTNLQSAIERFQRDTNLLNKMKMNSRISAEYYYIENYEDVLLNELM